MSLVRDFNLDGTVNGATKSVVLKSIFFKFFRIIKRMVFEQIFGV